MPKNSFFLLCLLAGAFFLTSCQASSDDMPVVRVSNTGETPQSLEFHQVTLGSASLRIMIARTEEQRKTGLMFRESLASDEGMLFVFEKNQTLNFWMKNTKIPLDIIFLTPELKIAEFIYGMVPGYGKPEADLPLYSTKGPALYALEVASGSIQRLGFQVGDRLLVPAPLLFVDH